MKKFKITKQIYPNLLTLAALSLINYTTMAETNLSLAYKIKTATKGFLQRLIKMNKKR